MDFDYLNHVTSKKPKKVNDNDKNFKLVSNLILKISILTLFGCDKIVLTYNTFLLPNKNRY